MSDAHAEPLTPKQAARIIGKSPNWLYRARTEGDGPPWYRIGGRIFYLSAELRSWFSEQKGKR